MTAVNLLSLWRFVTDLGEPEFCVELVAPTDQPFLRIQPKACGDRS